MSIKYVWEKLGLLVTLRPDIEWLAGGAGPCCAVRNLTNALVLDLYISGRDSSNRSRLGLAQFSLEKEEIIHINPLPVLSLGQRGAFDENGTSYPCVIRNEHESLMYYTGWIEGKQVPWYNDLGLAKSLNGISFNRVSRAPIFPRKDADFLGIGSSWILRDALDWHLWYTRFERWGSGGDDHPHYYNIKHAKSTNGLDWVSDQDICIDFQDESEYAVAKPCVLKIGNKFVMWYSYRGSSYLPGFAVSNDGIHWERRDDHVGITTSKDGWDSEMLCYPHVIEVGDYFYMFYNGNRYGVDGLGCARASRAAILEMIDG